jgi:hypothetical protein
MRGSSLDFNAPIVVKNGIYRYSDENYSIFKTSIDDMELLKKVMLLLLEESKNINNPELINILSDLSEKTGIEIPLENVEKIEILKSKITEHDLHDNLVWENHINICESRINYEDEICDFAESPAMELFNKYITNDEADISSVGLYSWDTILMLLE